MALDLYSKGTTDNLLADKLDLAGGTMTGGLTLSASGIIFSDATYLTTAPSGSTLAADQLTAGVVTANPTAGPTASGDVLSFDGTNLVWGPGGGGGSYLPLAGGTMTGAIVFDGTSGQYISKGNFDSSRGGNYGISLVCSIGYEFNWQAGWLTTTEQGTTTPRPLYLDSLAGTTLRVWDSSTSTGTAISHQSIVINSDATYDSELSGWGLGVELTADTTKGTTVEFDGVDTYDGASHMIVSPTGLTFPDATTQTTAFNGSYLPLAGGTMTGTLYVTDTYNTTTVASNDVKVLDQFGRYSELDPTSVKVNNGAGSQVAIYSNQITFADSTVQTTAWTGSVGKSVASFNNTTYTLSATDINNVVYCYNSGSSATNVIVIPTDSTYSFPVGTVITLANGDSSNGCVVNCEYSDGGGNHPSINGGSTGISISNAVIAVKVAADTWFVS